MLGGVRYPTDVTPPPREIALAGINWYGDDALWVIPPARGEVRGLSEKIPSYRLRHGTIEVGGRRVDAPSSLTPSGSVPGGYGDRGFQATGVTFPAAGCWEMTYRLGAHELCGSPSSFVATAPGS